MLRSEKDEALGSGGRGPRGAEEREEAERVRQAEGRRNASSLLGADAPEAQGQATFPSWPCGLAKPPLQGPHSILLLP